MLKRLLIVFGLILGLSQYVYGQANCSKLLAHDRERITSDLDNESVLALPLILDRDLPDDFNVRELNDSDIEYLTFLTEKITNKKNVDEEEVFSALVQAKRGYEARINENGIFIGQRVNETTRNMRKRRDQFELHIKSGDSPAASVVYRSLWESFYVSKSALLKYTRQNSSEVNNKEFLNDIKGTLLGLVESPHLRKLKSKVHSFYGVGRLGRIRHLLRGGGEPSLHEVLEVLDTIYALSRSEFMYANYRVKELLNSSDTSDSSRRAVVEFLGYMDPDTLSQRFRMNLLPKTELESKASAEELFRLRPQTLVLWLKHVSEVESWRTPVLLLRAGIQELAFKFTNLFVREELKRPLRRLIMLDYNTYVIDKHIERISSVVNAEPNSQIDVFLEVLGQGTSETQNQFLETFARLSEDVVVWNRIKKHFKDLSSSENTSRILVERMDEAEKYISTYGYLSKTHSVSSLDLIVGVGIRGATILTLTLSYESIINFTTSYLPFFN